MMNLAKVFPMQEYPIYLLADIMGCGPATIMRLIKKYEIPTFKKNTSRFILRHDAIHLLMLPDETCQKYFAFIKQNY